MGCSGTPLGLWDTPGEKDKPGREAWGEGQAKAGAIPCHAGKALEAEPGGCCLEGNKPLGRHLGLQR